MFISLIYKSLVWNFIDAFQHSRICPLKDIECAREISKM